MPFGGAPFIFGKVWIVTRSYDYPVVFLCRGPVYIVVLYQSRLISKSETHFPLENLPSIIAWLVLVSLTNESEKQKLETDENKIKWFYFAKQKSLNAYNECLFFPLCFHCDTVNFRDAKKIASSSFINQGSS